MEQIASLTEPGMKALLTGDVQQLAALMRLNFRLRRQLFGDEVIGVTNLKMVQVGQASAVLFDLWSGPAAWWFWRRAGLPFAVYDLAGEDPVSTWCIWNPAMGGARPTGCSWRVAY